MKKLNVWLMMSIITMMTIGVVACSGGSDDPISTEEPGKDVSGTSGFPTMKTMNIAAGSEDTFTFNVNQSWELSSDKMWITLISSEMKGQDISGKAGSQSIKVKVSAEGQDFTESTATLTMTMGGKSETVAKIVRAGKAYELKIYNTEGKEIQSLVIPSEGTLNFAVEANFECAATVPTWLEDVVLKDTDNKKTGTLTIKEGNTKNAQSGNITFANQNGSASFSIPVSYEGMDTRKIIIKSKDLETGSWDGWNWEVSLDGKTFTKNNNVSGSTNEIKEKMSFSIIARNDAYTPVFASITNNEYSFENINWIRLAQEGENATLTIDATDKEREGYVLVFPNTVYDEIKNDLKTKLFEKDTEGNTVIKYEYEQNYFLISFKQKDELITGFNVKETLGYKEIKSTSETDTQLLNFIQTQYSIEAKNVGTINAPASTPLMINPYLPIDIFNGAKSESCKVVWENGENVPWNEISQYSYLEAGLTEDEQYYYVTLRTPANFNKLMILIFVGSDSQNKKALVIRPA